MKKNIVLPTLIGIALIGGLVSQVKALPPLDALSTPINAEESPVNIPVKQPEISPPPMPTETQAEQAEQPLERSAFHALLAHNLPSRTIKKNKNGLAIVTNASSHLVLVNKERNLPATYKPNDLVIPKVPFSFSGDSPKKQLRKEAAQALEALFKSAKEEGIQIKAVSGYRSYGTQEAIFRRNAKLKGAQAANQTSARPGQSEHQTGLAMDISSASVRYALVESFGETKEGKWLAKNAAEHGFIIRYLKGKEDISGYSYEPWHIRYVGKEAATEISESKLTLEEYFDSLSVTVENEGPSER